MKLTDKDLAWLNDYVYTVDKAKSTKDGINIPKKNKLVELPKNKKIMVVDTVDNKKNGYQGLAVAPIINGKPDYNNVVVVSAGTNSKDFKDIQGALGGNSQRGSYQVQSADDFVSKLKKDGYNITQLSGYSQSAYMLKIGAKYKIPTTVFNGWFHYSTLTKEEQDFMKNNPELFLNYRQNRDLVTWLNDYNTSSNDYGTTVWVKGDSHMLDGWKFDKNGKLIVNDANDQAVVDINQIGNSAAILLKELTLLRDKLSKSGGSLSSSERIFLDSTESLIVLDRASKSMKVGIKALIKEYEKGIEEAEKLWEDTLEASRGIGTELSQGEILDALRASGVTKSIIVDKPCEEYDKKILEAKKMSENYDDLIKEIKVGIDKLVATDKQLAKEIGAS